MMHLAKRAGIVVAVSFVVLLLLSASALAAPSPNPTNCIPNFGRQGQYVGDITITGTDFGSDQSNTQIYLKNVADPSEVIDGSVSGCNPTQINGGFQIPPDASLGAWDVYVKHTDDGLTGYIPSGFAVTAGSTISGTVTHDGSGVGSITVVAFPTNGDPQGTSSATNGTYTISGLVPGSMCKVAFWDQSGALAFEYYNNKGTYASAMDVPAPSSDINEELEDSVTITGTVTDDTHNPIPNCYVAWSDSTGELSLMNVQTNALGEYTLSGLKSGVDYKVSFNIDPNGGLPPLPYTPQWYNGQFNWAEGGVVTAPHGNVDAQLSTDPAGTISGTVTKPNGDPLGNIGVIAFVSSSGLQAGMAQTDPGSGTYSIGGLTPGGNYKIVFYDETGTYAIEFYTDSGTWSGASLVTATATGKDEVMEPAMTITGTVTDAVTHLPIQNCNVTWCDATREDIVPPGVQTDVNGYYSLGGMKSGTSYKVDFEAGGYRSRWYNNKPDWTNADLALAGSGGINAALYSSSTPPPNPTNITPNSGTNVRSYDVVIDGTGFTNSTAWLTKTGETPIPSMVSTQTYTQISCTFNLTGVATGQWNVVVRNDDDQTGTITNGFTVYPQYDVNASVTGGHGTALPATQRIDHEANAAVNITPNAHYHIASITDNGHPATITNPYIVHNVTSNRDVVVTFAIDQNTVTASVSGGHGTVSPATQNIDYGASATVNITPESGYEINAITDNGASASVANPYVIHNVTGNHTVVATFKQTPVATSKWYLAEGSTDWGFNTYVAILNPNKSQVQATVTFLLSSGTPVKASVALPPESQASLNPSAYVGKADFSTIVESDKNMPISVDRTMTWTGPGAAAGEAHASVGVTSASTTWYLAEGSTKWNFECWLLIQNPNSQAATCQVTYMTNRGPQQVTKSVPANSRASFNVANDIGAADTSIKVASDVPVIAERSMYRYNRREGHESLGAVAPSSDYYLAEGSTGWGFTTYVLVQNPNDSANNVTLSFTGNANSGGPAAKSVTLAMTPNTRQTVCVNNVAGMANVDFSTVVHGDKPIIAERSMYWPSFAGETCHDSIGFAAPHKTFTLPDGSVNNGWETWVLIQNPNNERVTVNVTYLARDGAKPPATFQVSLDANSRKTLNMADKVSWDCGTQVSCSKPIMVERSMYRNGRSTGTNTIGGYSD